TPLRRGPTPRPSSTTDLALRDATSRGTRLPKLGYLRARMKSRADSGILSGERTSSRSRGTQMRPSLRSDSDISVSLDWNSSLAGMQGGWIWVKHGWRNRPPRRCARQMAVAFEYLALVDR